MADIDKHTSLLHCGVKYLTAVKVSVVQAPVKILIENFKINFSTGACTTKKFTAVICGFHNKLECLSLASLNSQV